VATTHHGMLKAFAHETEGVSNASMEFDQSTLKPTYRFKFGIRGAATRWSLRADLNSIPSNRRSPHLCWGRKSKA